MERTIVSLIAIMFFGLVPNAYAVLIDEDFDSLTNGYSVENVSGFSTTTSSASYLTTNVLSISAPHSMYYGSTNASGRLNAPIGASTEGVFSAIWYSTANNRDITLTLDATLANKDFELNMAGNQRATLKDNNGATTLYTFATSTASTWTGVTMEWRAGTVNLEVNVTLGTETTGWLQSTVPNTEQANVFELDMDDPLAFASPYLDNYYLATDDDFLSDSEFEASTGVTQEYDTQITDLDATQSASSTVVLNADWFIDQTELIESLPAKWPTLIQFGVTNETGSTTYERYYSTAINNQNATGTTNSATFTGLADGDYYAIARFYNQSSVFDSADYPFPLSYATILFTITGGNLVSQSVAEIATTETYNEITQYKPCSLTEIQGCIQNSFTYLFVPTSAQLQNFFDFQEEVPNRVPFNWYYELSTAITDATEMTGTTTMQTYTLDVPFLGADFEILSQDVVDNFIDDDTRALFRLIMLIALYMSFAIMVFFTIQGVFNKTDDGLKN